MFSTGDYPLGAANDPRAPYNRKENPKVEVVVTVGITLCKTVKVKVSDYNILAEGKDEDGSYFVDRDFSDTDFVSAVEDQIVLPQDASLYIDVGANQKAVEDLSGWIVDEIKCIYNEQ